MRLAAAIALIALFPAAAGAEEACGPLKIVDIVHMIPTLDGAADIVPVVIGGQPRSFLLDTGGYLSQLSRPLAEQLHLSILQERQSVYDATGNVSSDQVTVPSLGLGAITDSNVVLMVSPSLGKSGGKGVDGILAPDRLVKYDAELDFGSDTLNLFSPDHCPGHVVYWQAPATAVIPITLEQSRANPDHRDRSPVTERPISASALATNAPLQGFHIFVPVTLDGHVFKALIDTGANNSALSLDKAKEIYGLVMGSPDTPENGNLNGDATVKIYSHLFQNLAFGSVSVTNPRLTIMPNAMNRNVDLAPLVADRTRTERDLVNQPDMIIGMDVLRRLRLYLAFHEGKIYVSPASAPTITGMVVPYPKETLAAILARLDKELAASPNDAAMLNDRCFWRGITKENLDGALGDCDKSLALAPNVPQTLDSRAFVLFQQGKYQDALSGYDAALTADPNQAPSLFMRGLVEGKLGDDAARDTDLATARKSDPNLDAEFQKIGIEANEKTSSP